MKREWTEWFRFITPVLVTIGLFIMTGIREDIVSLKCDIKEVDTKLFKHLTNDELHCPRSLMVQKVEWVMYQEMRNKQMESLREDLNSRVSNLTKSIDKAIEALGYEKRGR